MIKKLLIDAAWTTYRAIIFAAVWTLIEKLL